MAYGLAFGVPFMQGGVAAVNPMSLQPLQWLHLAEAPATSVDKTANELDADYVENNAVTPDGIDDYLEVLDLVGTETVTSWQGTGTEPTISAGRIDFTAGTYYDLVLSSGHHFTFAEGAGVTAYNVGTGADGTWKNVTTAALHGTKQDVVARNAVKGCSKVLSFDGTDAYGSAANTGLGAGDFYYHWIGIVDEITDNYPIFCDGGAFAGGKRALLQMTEDGTSMTYVVDDDVLIIAFDLTVSYSVGDILSVKFSRSGSTCTAYLKNIKTGAEYSDTFTATTDYRSSQPFALSAWWDESTGEYSSFSRTRCVSFRAGTSEASIIRSYYAHDAYDNTLPDSTGTNDAALSNTEFLYIPALDDGTDDAAGLGLTNPAGKAMANCESKIKQKAANTEFLTNPFWSADGVNYDAKSWADFLAHLNFDNNVVVSRPTSYYIDDILTWPIDKEWTASEYQRMVTWLASKGDLTAELIPYPVTAGTGIGPSGTYYTYDGTHIYLVEDA